jgi:membrane protease YdiL (CAAX protease family)
MSLQGVAWRDLGLKKPAKVGTVVVTASLAALGLIPATYALRHLVTAATSQGPNLEAFQAVEGNVTALLIGLVVVWTFAAFGEELLFRGFLMNAFYRLMDRTHLRRGVKWAIALVATSVLVGLGHTYQGAAGMILTGILGLCFGGLYLWGGRNLWTSIGTHGLYDSAAFVILFLGIRPE